MHLVDHTDFCRACKGKGYQTSAPGEVSPRCRYCDGTGKRTVLVLPANIKGKNMPLYDEIYEVVEKSLSEEDAEFLAETLSTMPADAVRALFSVIDNYEPSETEQGLIPIPRGYAEQ